MIWINLYKSLSREELTIRLQQIENCEAVYYRDQQIQAIQTLLNKQ